MWIWEDWKRVLEGWRGQRGYRVKEREIRWDRGRGNGLFWLGVFEGFIFIILVHTWIRISQRILPTPTQHICIIRFNRSTNQLKIFSYSNALLLLKSIYLAFFIWTGDASFKLNFWGLLYRYFINPPFSPSFALVLGTFWPLIIALRLWNLCAIVFKAFLWFLKCSFSEPCISS